MEARRFDHLARSLSQVASRRGTLRLLASLPFAGVLAALVAGDADEAAAQAGVGGGGHHRRKIRRRRRARRRDNGANDNGKDKHKRQQKKRQRRKKRREREDETAPGPEPCTPACTGKSCGPDGCGGTCGPGCPARLPVCTAQGQCVAVAASCFDGILNGDETDIDCGGSCLPCADGQNCSVNADCQLPATCGGGGESGICGQQACVPNPNACQDAGAMCGTIGDGCGGIQDCGPCPPDQVCQADGSTRSCVPCRIDPTCPLVHPTGVVVPCCS